MLNTKPCNTCQNYDPIRNGLDQKGNVKLGDRGRCAVKSTYPFKEQRDQVFPPGVARVKDGELSKPFIVVGADVQGQCREYHGG